MSEGATRRSVILLLTEDTYNAPLRKLAFKIFAKPQQAILYTVKIDRTVAFSHSKLRKRIWKACNENKAHGRVVIEAHVFIDSEGSDRVLKKAVAVQRELEDPKGASKLACLCRIHVLKPNQEGFLLHAPGPILEASRSLIAQSKLSPMQTSKAQSAQRILELQAKLPRSKPGIENLFAELFCDRLKCTYTDLIAESESLGRTAFITEPACMRELGADQPE